ncbi:MAG: hypothetical protein ACK5MK_06625 [Dysgonomonas sp.]
MKAIIFSLFLFFTPFILTANNLNDTTIIEKKTTIISRDSISVINTTDTIIDNIFPSEVIADGSNYSFIFQWSRRHKLHPHWSGFAMSFLNYDDNNIPNGSPRISRSHAFSLNLMDYSYTFRGTNLLLVSGFGLDWHRYHFKDNAALTTADNRTLFKPAPDGINYKDSKLLAYYITIPLMLEFQPTSDIHISGGVVGYLKYYSKSQVKYSNAEGKDIRDDQGKDLNIRPVDMKFRLQAGISDFTAFATYSPFSMFDKDKGPDLKSYSIGLMLNF